MLIALLLLQHAEEEAEQSATPHDMVTLLVISLRQFSASLCGIFRLKACKRKKKNKIINSVKVKLFNITSS